MRYLFICVLSLLFYSVSASRLVDIQAVDNKCLMLHFQDGYVEYLWDDTISGSCNGWEYYHTENWHLCKEKDKYIPYGTALNVEAVKETGNYKLQVKNVSLPETKDVYPVHVYRKSKVWEASHTKNYPAMHHWVYLEFPDGLKSGEQYELQISSLLNSDKTSCRFIFDEYELESPSVKISNIGYSSSGCFKSADIYLWMGDGGKRDFSRFEGKPFHIYDIQNRQVVYTGKIKFHLPNKIEPRYTVDITGADVWECDFSSFQKEGLYKLVVEGMGCSPVFPISKNVYEEAFKVSMQGMFYQRMGCEEKPAGDNPYSRRPLYKQGVEPTGFKVYISEKEMVTGENPDNMDWYAEKNTGILVKESWGGWSDAYDNDQRPDNFICVFDILLAYYLAPSVYKDSQLYIPEVNNGIPDILDEVLWEIDWWLRMRDPNGGYLTGLCNIIPPDTTNYAGASCGWQGWCVAAACAMVADCFRLNGNATMQQKYLDAALEAYHWSERQKEQMLDVTVYELRGRDLKMTAAAYLYNLTGNKRYEDVVRQESVVTSPQSRVRRLSEIGQQYATAGYLLSPQKINNLTLHSNMLASVIFQAKADYVDYMEKSPTKSIRWTIPADGICMTSSEISLVALAHRLSDHPDDKRYFERGLYAEAEWTLGRNPLGLVQITGLSDRCYTQTFAPGRRDGYPGITPGWTPYMMRDGWMKGDNIHGCEWYTNRNYPTDKLSWPSGEHFWNSRYCVPNSENTPQQAFRQKILLYGYLYSMAAQ